MPMQNAALWILLVDRPRKHELSLPEAQDDTITEPLGEGWGYDVRRHDYRRKSVRSSCAKVSCKWGNTWSYIHRAQHLTQRKVVLGTRLGLDSGVRKPSI